jgi:hypothetical protein
LFATVDSLRFHERQVLKVFAKKYTSFKKLLTVTSQEQPKPHCAMGNIWKKDSGLKIPNIEILFEPSRVWLDH